MSAPEQRSRQRTFYESREHSHLQPREGEFYAAKLAAQLAAAAGIRPEHRGLELGAGFGRFTFSLLDHCASLTALDLSPRALETLERTRNERSLPEARCRTLCSDVDALAPEALAEPPDFAVGFFFLHHLPDFAATIAHLVPLLRPGGRLAFVEPNRRNPLFTAQMLCCPDMSWREEIGMWRLSRAKVEDAYRRAGLTDIETRTFGFFPPQILNRSPASRRLERRLEQVRWLRGALPFLLLSARASKAR